MEGIIFDRWSRKTGQIPNTTDRTVEWHVDRFSWGDWILPSGYYLLIHGLSSVQETTMQGGGSHDNIGTRDREELERHNY